MALMLGPNRVIAKEVKSCTYCCYIRCATLIVWVGVNAMAPNSRNSVPCTVRTPDKGRAIKGLVVCNNWDLEPLDLLNGLALGCYQPSFEVLEKYNKNHVLDCYKNSWAVQRRNPWKVWSESLRWARLVNTRIRCTSRFNAWSRIIEGGVFSYF